MLLGLIVSGTAFNLDSLADKLKKAYLRKTGKDRRAFVGFVASCTLLSLFVCFVLDYLTGFPAVIRLALTLGVLGYFCGYLVWQRRRTVKIKTDLVDMAREIELRAQELKSGGFYSVLVSATEFVSGDGPKGSEELRGLVVEQAGQPDFDPNELVLHDPVKTQRTRKLLIATLVVYLFWALIGTHSLVTFLGRTFGLPLDYKTRTQIVTVGYTDTIARFEDLLIHVDAEGVLPARGELILSYAGDAQFSLPLEQDIENKSQYLALVERPLKNFKFTVRLGDDRTRSYSVEVVRPPVIATGAITLHPPAYTQLPDQVFNLESFNLLEGSTFDVRVTASKVVKSCTFERGELEDVLKVEGEGYEIKGLSQKASSPFSIRLVDKKGVENKNRLQYAVTLVSDEPPSVAVLAPKPSSYFAPPSILRWTFKASDDFGMAKATLLYEVKTPEELGDEGQVVKAAAVLDSGEIDLGELEGEKNVERSGRLVIRDLGLKPGHVAELRIRVSDRNTQRKDGGQGLSQPLLINVVSAAELKSILSEELYGAHLMIQDIQDDMKGQKKTVELKLKHSKGGAQ